MKLGFVQRHLSITAFPDIELPPLAIVLGINGSGKTHLLQAIANGSVSNDVFRVQTGQMVPTGMPGQPGGPIKLMMANQFGFQQTPYTSQAAQMAQPMQPAMGTAYEPARTGFLARFVAQLDAVRPGFTSCVRPTEDIWRLGAPELIRRGGLNEEEAGKVHAIFAAANEAISNVRSPDSTHMVNPHFYNVRRVAAKLRVPAVSLTESQLQQFMPWQTDQFETNLAMVFGKYRDALVRNRLARMEDEATGSKTSMTDSEFLERFGSPPWEQVSENFKAFGLPYVALGPDLFSYNPVSFSIVKVDSGEAVDIHNLSSGEKILFQFALSVFRYDEDITTVTRPKLLLLDEMDAPLHPEMVNRWLNAISDGLVRQQGLHCILTTHSPTTIALAPEESLYEMRNGRSGLTKISKQDALNKLTFGVPTLSIDFSGRRQVFTESDTDAAIYERVYSLIKSRVDCVRELNFLSTGMRNKDGGEVNSGCTVVTNIVQRLNETGNMSVFGIVDWDGEAVSTDRVRVIAEGTHDGIENLLLDPLLICLLLMKERRPPEGLHDIERFAGADTLSAIDLQRLVEAIQQKALPTNSGKRIPVAYLDGASTNVLEDYLLMDDHALEDALRAAFPYLRKWSNRGALVMAVVDEVLTEHRGFCPAPLKTMFEGVANA